MFTSGLFFYTTGWAPLPLPSFGPTCNLIVGTEWIPFKQPGFLLPIYIDNWLLEEEEEQSEKKNEAEIAV